MNRHYPETLAECIQPNRKYKPAVLRAVKAFARAKPWRGSIEERKAKFVELHAAMCEAYGVDCDLEFCATFGRDITSGRSSCQRIYSDGRLKSVITLRGRSSVVTYLHEFAHALGKDEHGAVRWSVNLFARCFPKSFAQASAVGHMVIKG